MDSTPTPGPPAPQADHAFERQLREMNETLLVSSVRQHELAEQAQKAEAALRDSGARLRQSNEELATVNDELNNRNQELTQLNTDLVNLLGSVQMAIVLLGPDLCVRRFSPSAEIMLNVVPTDVGRPIGQLKLNLDLPELAQLLTEVLHTARTKECEVQDRQGRWYSLRIRPYKTLENEIDGVVLMLIDVDTLKRALENTAGIVATVREPLLVLDADLRVRTASRSFYQTFQVRPEETENRLLYDLGNGQWNLPELRRLLETVLLEDNQFSDFEVECEFAHLGRRTVLLNARRLLEGRDRASSILLAIEDVTERKRREESSRQRVEELAVADRYKNEFLAMLAHELRNPLAPIRNMLEVMERVGGNSDVLRQARATMDRQLQHMNRLINDLLDVSRISRGKIELRTQTVELTAILSGTVEALQDQLQTRAQKLVVSLPPEPVYLEADRTRLEQVFGNLLTNASKYNDRGSHVWLTAERARGELQLPGAAAEVIVRVRDDGIGIAAKDLPRIFDMFTQVNTSLERSQGGLGIGLTLVKKLVEMHGGTVVAHSAGAGQGSEFVVRLPVLVEAPQLPEPQEPANGEQAAATACRRILVVDDNQDSAESLAMLLKHTGNEARTAYDGLEAVEAAKTFRPDVILLDIGMPKLNGYDAAGRIREQPWGQRIVLVALTGWGQEEDRRRSRAAGFDGHLVKPVEYDVLMKLLAELQPNPV